jgi:hypothetical protein
METAMHPTPTWPAPSSPFVRAPIAGRRRLRATLFTALLACLPGAAGTARAGEGFPGELFTEATRFTVELRDRLPGSDRFWDVGWSVAMTDELVVVGAPFAHNETSSQGVAAVYERGPGGTWVRSAILTALDPPPGDRLGIAVGVSGDTVVATTPGRAGHPEAAYVFVRPPGGWADMVETAKLTPSDGELSFGSSVAISGDTIVVGAPKADGPAADTGAVYLFDRPATGWATTTQTAKMINPVGLFGALFGTSVALDGDTLLVGAPRDNGNFPQDGGVGYLFVRGPGGWGPHRLLIDPDMEGGQLIGGSVALRDDTAVLGTGYVDHSTFVEHMSGGEAAYVFVRPSGGWPSVSFDAAKIAWPFDGNQPGSFGMAVAATHDLILVSARAEDMWTPGVQPFPEGGQVYAFERPAGGWEDVVVDIQWAALHPASFDPCSSNNCGLRFGRSLAMSSSAVAVGAPGPAIGNSLEGLDSLYIFSDPLVVFADGFENGNTSAWSGVVP